MDSRVPLPTGQQQARTRWRTHESGAAFDRKKTPSLTERARQFMARRAFCVVAGLGPDDKLAGLMVMARPGFVKTPDRSTCLLQFDGRLCASPLLQRLAWGAGSGQTARLGLFFISHISRERLCVQGTAELLSIESADDLGEQTLPEMAAPVKRWQFFWRRTQQQQAPASPPKTLVTVRLHVRQAFFHCPKYIRASVPGLTSPPFSAPGRNWRLDRMLALRQRRLPQEVIAFLQKQAIGFLCTVNRYGQCAVNHRGGAPGFLIPRPSSAAFSGRVLLPDYAGNGAFEAIGNIVETGQAALVVPNYTAQMALCLAGRAKVLEPAELPADVAQQCAGAERVIALAVERIQVQRGGWSPALTYERAYSEVFQMERREEAACPLPVMA